MNLTPAQALYLCKLAHNRGLTAYRDACIATREVPTVDGLLLRRVDLRDDPGRIYPPPDWFTAAFPTKVESIGGFSGLGLGAHEPEGGWGDGVTERDLAEAEAATEARATPPPSPELREQIAAIIDPHSWKLWADNMAAMRGDIIAGQRRVRAASLKTADAILSLIFTHTAAKDAEIDRLIATVGKHVTARAEQYQRIERLEGALERARDTLDGAYAQYRTPELLAEKHIADTALADGEG